MPLPLAIQRMHKAHGRRCDHECAECAEYINISIARDPELHPVASCSLSHRERRAAAGRRVVWEKWQGTWPACGKFREGGR